MKTIVTERLTLAYLQKLRWQNYLATAMAALLIFFSLLWLLFRWWGNETTIAFADIMYPVASLTGTSWVMITVYRAHSGPAQWENRYRFAWLLVGLGMLFDGLGGAYYAYLELGGHVNPTPSLADVGFTLSYPLVFFGLMMMPAGFKSERFRTRLALDALITTLCLLGVSWFFFIGPAYASTPNQQLSFDVIIPLTYPFLDMLIIFSVSLLILRPAWPVLRFSLILVAIALFAETWADTSFFYFSSINVYKTGTPYIDPFWFIYSFLLGLAALYQYSAIAKQAYSQNPPLGRMSEPAIYTALNVGKRQPQRSLFIQSLLVYLPFTILLILLIYDVASLNTGTSLFLTILTAIVGILVVVRYLLTGYENDILLQEREQQGKEAERLRLLTAQLAETLDLNPLLERIVALATSALAFDTAILFVEDRAPSSSSTSEPTFLSIYAATSAIAKVTRWRFYGSQVSHFAPLQRRKLEVCWLEQAIDLPSEIIAWQKDQHVLSTLFIPLTYQGKNLGSLGFSSRTMPYFKQEDKYIAQTFAEQAATALEHAYLYHEAREQEAFAQALANIATRLNMAAVEPREIQQVICSEAANALRADYALLYSPGDFGSLVPTAIAMSEQEPHADLSDWPCIYEHEYEAQPLTTLQPALIQLGHLYSLEQGYIPPLNPAFAHRAYAVTRRLRMQRARSLSELFAQRSVPTAILAPLIARNAPVGLLVLARSLRAQTHDKKAFASEDLPQAQDFAEQAAVAFTNAQLYHQLRTAHRRLQELDQLKDQFMITASHELRTPLTAVQGYLELMVQYEEVLPLPQRQEFLRKAQRGCDELVLLLSDVMDASRLEVDAGIRPAHMESVFVLDIIQNILELIEPQLVQERREVHTHISQSLAVRADPIRLRQIIRNLSLNALKYSPSGSPIVFSANTVVDTTPCVVISIADQGKGITPEEQAHLFQRFVRLERDVNSPVRGSGLGLYISRRLVEAMKGKIWVESSGVPGEGSVFNVQLPMAE